MKKHEKGQASRTRQPNLRRNHVKEQSPAFQRSEDPYGRENFPSINWAKFKAGSDFYIRNDTPAKAGKPAPNLCDLMTTRCHLEQMHAFVVDKIDECPGKISGQQAKAVEPESDLLVLLAVKRDIEQMHGFVVNVIEEEYPGQVTYTPKYKTLIGNHSQSVSSKSSTLT